MSHSRFHLYWKYVLRRAWLSLWNKHMLPTGSIGYHRRCSVLFGGGCCFNTSNHTMHRVLCCTPTTWVSVFHSCCTTRWCTLLVLWCNVPLFSSFTCWRSELSSHGTLFESCTSVFRSTDFITTLQASRCLSFLSKYVLLPSTMSQWTNAQRRVHLAGFNTQLHYE